MDSVLKKITYSLMTLLLVPTLALALDTEYKNSLNKVELKQTSDSTYDVNLYMQKKFNEPVKVIKKSDLNYYILLPETKNASSGVSKTGSGVSDASANSHKYAGADVNNGYTKININTTKPINFNINVKNTSDVASYKTKTANGASKVSSEAKATANLQKKNSDTSSQKSQVELKEKKDTVKKAQAQQQKPAASAAKKTAPAQKAVLKQPISANTKKAVAPKAASKQVQKPVQNNTSKQAQKTAVKQSTKTTQKAQPKVASKQAPKPVQNAASKPAPVAKEIAVQEEIQEPKKTEVPPVLAMDSQEFTTEPQEEIQKEEPIIEEEELPIEPISESSSFSQSFINKITEYGLSLNDIFFMLFASLISLIALFVILRKPNESQAKLKTKADLIGKLDKTERFVPKKVKEPIENGKYFVFDKSVKQTAFCEPASAEPKKQYELSNYDPDLNIKYGKETSYKESEYDIIQKILKEDSLVEIAPGEFETKVYEKEKIHQEQKAVSKPIVQEVIKEEKPKTEVEPKVLSSIEIAPERGFMVISYNNNINLMGYIFDDVFALYNFKQDKIENAEIKYRLSDKDDKGTNFIVKVDSAKIVVRVTKSQMNLLVVM